MEKKWRAVFVSLALFIFLFSYAYAAGSFGRQERTAINFSLQDLKGKTYTLTGYKDKHSVVLFFWTTWCPFCRQELKAINDLYPQLQKDGLEILAIDVEESANTLERFLQRYALFIPVLLDRNAAVARDYDVMGVPTVFIVNKEGHIVFEGNHFPRQSYKTLLEE